MKDKPENFFKAKETRNKVQRQAAEWGEKFASHVSLKND